MQDISKEQMIELYSKLLKWVVDDSSAGLIIKSKFGSFVSTIIDSIPNLWLQAILSGRVYCVDEYKMLPIIVSKASDLTIGTGISTAAMESAIAELKTLYYYPASTGNHYLEKKMSNVLVFKDVDKLMEAVISIQRGDENLGDTGSMASIMNPYKDEKGPERISIVINALMNSNNKEQFSKIIKSLILQFEHNRSA